MTPLEKQLAEALDLLVNGVKSEHRNGVLVNHSIYVKSKIKQAEEALAEYNRQLSHPGAQY